MDQYSNGSKPIAGRAVNDDMRRAAANLATIIRECGLSQSELSRRSGLSRQLINGWARQRLSVSLSATVGRFLSGIDLTLGDLLLDEKALYSKLGRALPSNGDALQFFPRMMRMSKSQESQERLDRLAGTFRYRTRLKESPIFVLERTFQFEPRNEHGPTVRAFDGPRVGNKSFAEGYCVYHEPIFFVFVESTESPHQPLIYAYRDPLTDKVNSLNGVSIAPSWFGSDSGLPLTRLVYMHRTNPDGSAIADADFDPDREFNTFVPADACTVLTTY
jgi:transcriptional regulator with XRE-family HTH domain